MSDEIDLNALGDDDLVQQMHDDLYDGLKEEIEQGVRILLSRRTLSAGVCARSSSPAVATPTS